MTSFKPAKPINLNLLKNAIIDAGNEISEGVAKDYSDVQATWNNADEPIEKKTSPYRWTIEVKGKIFRYVDHGTRKRKIRAKRAKTLAFRTGYKRKSTRGSLTAKAGGPFGDVAFAKEINHPGTQSRDFTRTIAFKWFETRRAASIADKHIKRVIK